MVTLFLCVLTTGIVAAGMGRLTYDHNLLNLQPKGIESVELERVLLNESDHSVWHAISVSHSRDELLARKEQFENLSSVDRTEEIVSLLPEDPEQKTPVIARIKRRLAFLPQQPPLIPVASPAEIRRELAAAGVVLEGNDQQVRATQHRLSRIGDKLVRMSDREVYERISALQQTMAGDLLSQLRALRDVSLPEPPSLDDLPASLVSRFVGKSEHHLLRIYGEGDIWDAEALETFVTDVKRIDPRVTGHPLQTYFASHQMQRSYINAAIYALAAVVVILLVDFRKFSLVALALLPVGAGMLQMFGVMGLLGIPLNPANMIALPLILGVGLDDGVHVVHDFRRQRGKYRVSASTATAIVVTTLTTMIGFGSLMLSSHQGLQSLGRVLTIGVMCCLLSSLVLLPALLRWMSDEGIPSEQAQQKTQPALNTPASSDDPATNETAENPVPRRRSA